LADRHQLPARHLEPVLQALVHHGILKGIRGPRGGYELARERRRINVDDILRAVGSLDEDGATLPASESLREVVLPAVAEAEGVFGAALRRITIEDMAHRAEAMDKEKSGEHGRANFAI
jgi:Rrf2 family protein